MPGGLDELLLSLDLGLTYVLCRRLHVLDDLSLRLLQLCQVFALLLLDCGLQNL